MKVNNINIIFGGALWTAPEHATELAPLLKSLAANNIFTIDTSAAYGDSEALLGEANAAATFNIDTKAAGGFGETPSTAEEVIRSGTESLRKLKAKQLDVFYIHGPDKRVPWVETMKGLDALYRRGVFRRLGLSNFPLEMIDEVMATAKENGFVAPSVYQGNYSALARHADEQLLPVLRKHNIKFYAYSPIAGGFLAKKRADVLQEGRFTGNIADMFNPMFNRRPLLEALDVWEGIAADEGVGLAEMAYRWALWHSGLRAGDAIIVGAEKVDQLEETVKFMKKGRLSEDAVTRIGEMWEFVKGDAFLDLYQMVNSAAEKKRSGEEGQA